ncbi:MAG: PEP-CTERM sorting domain-containing protein [Chthoniobacteraceae bacterium]
MCERITTSSIDLFDADGNDRLYQANFTEFTQNVEMVIALTFISQSGAFNGTVSSLGLLTAGTGSTVDLKMDTLTAVPEPASCALFGAGTVCLLSLANRRQSGPGKTAIRD